MELEKALSHLKNGVEANYPMSELTSFRVGGRCDYLVRPADVQELQEIVRACRREGVPYLTVGRGTNLLVKDGGIRGVVILMGAPFAYCRISRETVTAGAALFIPQLAWAAMEEGLGGLEFAAGIPGTVGGGLFMNAGAYGRSLSDFLEGVTYLTPDGRVEQFSPAKKDFSYRWSIFREKRGVIVEAYFKLKRRDPGEIKAEMEVHLQSRRSRHPSSPSAGSVFRNPAAAPAGHLIERAGCKGMQVGGARVSRKHANFIVNTGEASARDILSLISRVRRRVKEKLNVELQLEVEVVGED